MRNTDAVTAPAGARSPWLDRPAADRDSWNAFRAAAGAVLAHVDAGLQREFKVGYSDVDALLHLATASEDCPRMASLARAVSRSPSAVTRLVDRLERRRLVRRTRHTPTDVSVSVTREGLDMLTRVSPRALGLVEERFWSRLDPHERARLAEICRKLLDSELDPC